MGVMLSAAGSLRWLRDVAAARRRATTALVAAAGRLGRRAPRGCSSCPYLAGERTPHADPDARGAFVGPRAAPRRGALIRGPCSRASRTACATAWSSCGGLGVRAESARVSGGGARSALWLRICASVLGSRSSGRAWRRARPTAPRCSAGWRAGASRAWRRRSPPACGSRRRPSRIRTGPPPTPRSGSASGRPTRRSRRCGGPTASPLSAER